MNFRKVFGWFIAVVGFLGLFNIIIGAILTICSSSERTVFVNIDMLPAQLFVVVVCGWIAYSLLGKRQKQNEQPIEHTLKINLDLKWFIYFCEAIIVILGSSIVSSTIFVISNSVTTMQIAYFISILAITYFLPTPHKLIDWWRKRKSSSN